MVEALRSDFGDFEATLNPDKPRRGAFEISVVLEDKKELVWTGLKKGPPRKMKFPEPEAVAEEIKKLL